MLGKAIELMVDSFRGINDKGGNPYSLHCLRVWDGVKHLSIDAQCAAILHDVIEDTDLNNHDLYNYGFSEETIRLVGLLTHHRNQPYDKYIEQIATCPIASKIKMSDLKDNSDLTRLKGVTKKDLDRHVKYIKSFNYLSKV